MASKKPFLSFRFSPSGNPSVQSFPEKSSLILKIMSEVRRRVGVHKLKNSRRVHYTIRNLSLSNPTL